MSTPVTIQPSINLPSFADVFGAGLIGSWISMCLYGLTTTQSYIYWLHYPKDSLWTKLLVIFLWILNTAHSISMCHSAYFHLVQAESDPNLISQNEWSFNTNVLLYIIVYATVTSYYMRVIFRLSSKRWRWWLIGCLAVPALLFLAFALETCIRGYMSRSLVTLIEIAHNPILPTFILQCISDASITISLCLLLYVKRADFQRTRHILNSLIIYAASRGLLTLMVTFIMVLALAIRPDEMWYCGPQFILVGLYTNSLMTMLNTRRSSCDPDTTEIFLEVDTNKRSDFSLPSGDDIGATNKAASVNCIALCAKGTRYIISDKPDEAKSAV